MKDTFTNIKEHLITYSENFSEETVTAVDGAWFENSDGQRYLNLNDIACVLGYDHPRFTSTLISAAQHCPLGHFGVMGAEKEKMLSHFMEVSQGAFSKIFIAGSGGEVVDWSLKLARRASGKDRIISYDRSLHGRSFAGAYISGLPLRKEGFGSGLENVVFLPGLDIERDSESDLSLFEDAAAVIVEPYQAANGLSSPTPEYWQWLRAYTREKGIVLIFDEIQTGFGKTGTFFAYQHLGIVPDILLAGKGMSNGFGLGAMLVSDEISKKIRPNELSGGSADSEFMCAIVNAVFDIYKEEQILTNVKEMAALLKTGFAKALESHGIECRFYGSGLFMALECDNGLMAKVSPLMKKHGVITGLSGDRLIIRSPLILSKSDVEFVTETFAKSLKEALACQ